MLTDLKAETGLDSWHFTCDNPTFLGWSVVAIYGLAALSCAVAAVHSCSRNGSSAPRGRDDSPVVWWALALALAFLGANKQLNFQTMFIVIMRRMAFAGGWWAHRRQAQLAFSAAFGLALGALLIFLALRYRDFFEKHRHAFWGLIILAVFVGLRAATINHADEYLRINLGDNHWGWILEIAGSLLIGFGAMQQAGGKSLK